MGLNALYTLACVYVYIHVCVFIGEEEDYKMIGY